MLDRFQFARLAGLKKFARSESALVSETATAARVVCIASGKGGTGKSVLATNVAVLRSRRGERVLLVDFDAGLANAHLLLGLAPKYDLGHVLEGEVGAEAALVDGPHGLKLLSGGVGRQTLVNPTRRELDRLFKALRPLEERFDLVVVDHGAGLSYSTIAHLAATSTLILVTNHEVTALSDAYALYKRATALNPHIRVGEQLAGGVIKDPDALLKIVSEQPHVLAAAPVISAQMLIAISGTVWEPMSMPSGAWTRDNASAEIPSDCKSSKIILILRRLPISPTYRALRSTRKKSAS